MGGETKLPDCRIKVKGSGGRGEKASTALGSKVMGKSQPLLALLSLTFFSSELSLLKGTLSWLMRRLGVPSQETRQIHAGSGAGVRSTLHRVRVPAPLLCGARMGDPDALWALLQLLSGRVPSSNSVLVFCFPRPSQPLSLSLSGFRAPVSRGPREGAVLWPLCFFVLQRSGLLLTVGAVSHLQGQVVRGERISL